LSVLLLSVLVTPASAKGCLKGAVVGGVAGHYAGHHGVIGAAAGCFIGRHQTKKRAHVQQDMRHADPGSGADPVSQAWPRAASQRGFFPERRPTRCVRREIYICRPGTVAGACTLTDAAVPVGGSQPCRPKQGPRKPEAK
jgi:hypothetical protein